MSLLISGKVNKMKLKSFTAKPDQLTPEYRVQFEKIIDDIEYVLRFLFEKYFNHYYQVIANILGEDSAGENWASLLEYGTQNRIAIALQNIGLSRHTALAIYRKCRHALNVEDGKLKSVNKNSILSEFKNGTLEHDEINRIL